MRSLALCLVVFLQVSTGMSCADAITIENGGHRGDWGVFEVCPEGTLATGFRLQVERKRGWFVDDTALNSIELYCTKNASKNVIKKITSSIGDFGSWRSSFFCKSGFLTSFCLRVEQNSRDNTAANNIKFRCSNSDDLEGDGLDWGNYGSWSDECPQGIYGLKSRVERSRGLGHDDTALNDVQFLCYLE